jgi:hypothetical protein
MNGPLVLPKRFLLGQPLRTERLGDTLLPKRLALPVFCSDPLSSVAYATEEILLMLSLGGLALLHLTWPVAAVVITLLIVVVASYRQTCYAYPNGGGAYAVSRPISVRAPPWSPQARYSSTTSSPWPCRWPRVWRTSCPPSPRWPRTR